MILKSALGLDYHFSGAVFFSGIYLTHTHYGLAMLPFALNEWNQQPLRPAG